MNIKTLSFYGDENNYCDDTFETFFDTYNLTEEIECYQVALPDDDGDESLSYLTQNCPKYTFQTRVVILNIQSLILDRFGNIDMDGLIKFCEYHHDQEFIIFNPQINFKGITRKNSIGKTNLYMDTLNSSFLYNIENNSSDESIHLNRGIQKKKISNQWLFLNSNAKLHKLITLCYLLSKDYYKNGLISMGNRTDHRTLVQDYYIPQRFDKSEILKNTSEMHHDVSKISSELKDGIRKGYERIRSKDFNKLKTVDLTYELKDAYYNDYLSPVYETTGVEIVAGVSSFEQFPIMSGKYFRSVYAKHFPIYINGIGMVKWMEDVFGLDMFRDIVDHSYDEITDHFERLTAAIDRNAHLLDGSTNIHELWHDNKKRFEDNCEKMDKFIQDEDHRRTFNHEKIKKALTHFGISVVNKSE
jgi:hypothetical protein